MVCPWKKQNFIWRSMGNRRYKIMELSTLSLAKGQHLYDDDYDFDEMNSEIVLMFGGGGRGGMTYVANTTKFDGRVYL